MQGVGKGTYSVRVAKAFGMDHIAAGDLVRAEMKSGSKLGAEVGLGGVARQSCSAGPFHGSRHPASANRVGSHHPPAPSAVRR